MKNIKLLLLAVISIISLQAFGQTVQNFGSTTTVEQFDAVEILASLRAKLQDQQKQKQKAIESNDAIIFELEKQIDAIESKL